MDLWYTEKHSENVGITMKVTKSLFSGESEFQKLEILETLEYGQDDAPRRPGHGHRARLNLSITT